MPLMVFCVCFVFLKTGFSGLLTWMSAKLPVMSTCVWQVCTNPPPQINDFFHQQRQMPGSGSDGTEDSDSSAEREQTNSSESDGNIPKRQRLTRASTRLSQSSQGQLIQHDN